MHPVAVIISVLMGTTLVGGVIGVYWPFRWPWRCALYSSGTWVKRELPEKAVQMEVFGATGVGNTPRISYIHGLHAGGANGFHP